MNRQVASYEVAVKEGSHSLSGLVYEPDGEDSIGSPVGTMTGGTNVLGGVSSTPLSIEQRRARAVEAAMRRFEEQEAEIEDRCAT